MTPPLPPAPSPIQRFGKYYLVRKLAEGGMAEIFLAKQVGAEGFERNVVIKRMLKHLSENPDFVAMFLDEARLAARLDHPNVVQLHDLGTVDGAYFICMEYLPGEDFSGVLRAARRAGGHVPLPLVLRVLADACHGLHFAHTFTDDTGRPLNIVHRDISPSNVFVTYQGQVKVLDFGIARAESRLANTTAGTVKGKYMYMSPEQARGEVVDRRSDVFSLGVTLYEALTHVRPFARDSDLAVLHAVLTCSFKPPTAVRPELPVELEQIVLKAMAPRAEERFQTAAELAAALEEYLASSSSGGHAQLGAFVRSVFPSTRVENRTRIPTLGGMIRSGLQVPGFTDPGAQAPAAANVADFAEQPTLQVAGPSAPAPASAPLPGATPAPPPAPNAPPSRSGPSTRALAGGALLFLAVAAAAGLGLRGAFSSGGGAGEKPLVGEAAVSPQAPAPEPEPEPVAAAPEPVAPPAAPAQPAAAQPRKRTSPVKLSAAEIQSVVNRSRGAINRCFEQHKGDLPEERGRVDVQFSVAGSGKVEKVSVAGPLAGSGVGTCLAGRIARLGFPPHVDQELTLTLPFQYEVER